LKRLKPQSVEQIAMILAIIRPAKSYLKNSSWAEIEKNVWEKDEDGQYQFKKSHAISYALSIVVQLNLLVETSNGTSD
jgi:DNA polymerase III alpha subunit